MQVHLQPSFSGPEQANELTKHASACLDIEFKIVADQSRELHISVYGSYVSRMTSNHLVANDFQ
jgi:hypothetical protein